MHNFKSHIPAPFCSTIGRQSGCAAILISLSTALACDGSNTGSHASTACAQGSETCPCYGNMTCDDGLVCASKVCVAIEQGGAPASGGSTSASGGAPASGGTTQTATFATEGGTSSVTSTAPSGGNTALGGTPAAGGTSATGGGTTVGGTSASGGTPLPAGASSLGGAVASGGSTSATGGSNSGMAGSTVTGVAGAASARCMPETMIDDMEDQETSVCPNAGRNGSWYTAAGVAATITPSPSTQFSASSIVGGRGTSYFGMHASGAAITTLDDENCWAVLGANLTKGAAYDASHHTGIQFWARASSSFRLRVNVSTTSTRTIADGGGCDPTVLKCNDYFGNWITLSSSWQLYSLPFSNMSPVGWGDVMSANFGYSWAIEFHYARWPYLAATANPSTFDYWIDDLSFY